MGKRVIYHVACYDFWKRKLNYSRRIFFLVWTRFSRSNVKLSIGTIPHACSYFTSIASSLLNNGKESLLIQEAEKVSKSFSFLVSNNLTSQEHTLDN